VSPDLIRILITAGLLLHGVAHAKAFFALLRDAATSGARTAVPVRAWIAPSLPPRAAALLAASFWLVSTLGFIDASLTFWGILPTGHDWRQMAIVSAITSSVGSVVFSGIWPGAPSRKLSILDTAIALVVNAAILALLLGAGWPPQAMFGK
jgi:hypothetical protein